MSMLKFLRHLRSFRLKDLRSCEVLSPMYGMESQMVIGSSLRLVLSAVRVLLKALNENWRISEFAI